MRQYLNFEELENGNLKVSLTDDGKAELPELLVSDKDYQSIWYDLIEYQMCNGSYQMVHPEKIAALTDAPIIGLNVNYDEESNIDNESGDLKIWYFEPYMVVNEFEELLNEPYIIFVTAD